nr:anthrone oxygenase family protein [Agromyces luteolus]
MIAIAEFVSLMLVGLVAGILLATQLGQLRVQRRLGARDFTLVKHEFEVALGRVMPVLVIAAGVSIVPLVVLRFPAGPAAFVAALAALALWIGVIVVTLVFNAPVNALAARWDPESPPEDWQALRAKWHRGQTIRTPLAVAAFAGVALASVLPMGGAAG